MEPFYIAFGQGDGLFQFSVNQRRGSLELGLRDKDVIGAGTVDFLCYCAEGAVTTGFDALEDCVDTFFDNAVVRDRPTTERRPFSGGGIDDNGNHRGVFSNLSSLSRLSSLFNNFV